MSETGLETIADDIFQEAVKIPHANKSQVFNTCINHSIAVSLKRIADAMEPKEQTLKGGIPFEKVLDGLRQWCDHSKDDDVCELRNTRYDNCRCEQQAGTMCALRIR